MNQRSVRPKQKPNRKAWAALVSAKHICQSSRRPFRSNTQDVLLTSDNIVFRYTPPWSEGGKPYVVVYGKTGAAARIVYPDGETMSGDLMRSPGSQFSKETTWLGIILNLLETLGTNFESDTCDNLIR